MFENDLDIIAEHNGYRARLEYDDSGEPPYDDGATPILTISSRQYDQRVEAFNSQAQDYMDAVQTLVSMFDMDTAARYLRIFHGAHDVAAYWSNGSNGYYLAFDTDAWAAQVGCPDDRRKLAADASLTEIRAWVEGDVYGVIIEKAVNYTKSYDDSDAIDEDGTEWIVVDAVWGFYGRDYAEAEAKASLENYAGKAGN